MGERHQLVFVMSQRDLFSAELRTQILKNEVNNGSRLRNSQACWNRLSLPQRWPLRKVKPLKTTRKSRKLSWKWLQITVPALFSPLSSKWSLFWTIWRTALPWLVSHSISEAAVVISGSRAKPHQSGLAVHMEGSFGLKTLTFLTGYLKMQIYYLL